LPYLKKVIRYFENLDVAGLAAWMDRDAEVPEPGFGGDPQACDLRLSEELHMALARIGPIIKAELAGQRVEEVGA